MIKFFTDHFFCIGSDHVNKNIPCQDYCTSGTFDDIAYAIVSDGCSGGDNTDVGSRVITLATAKAIKENLSFDKPIDEIEQDINIHQRVFSKDIANSLNLSVNDMIATCIYSFISPSGGKVNIKGDGVVAFKYKNGDIVMHKFSWEENAPFYIAQTFDRNSLNNFLKRHNNNLDGLRLEEEIWIKKPGKDFEEIETKKYSLRDGIRGVTINIEEKDLLDLEFIGIFSDGIEQMNQSTSGVLDFVDWKNMVEKLLYFPQKNGEFAKRTIVFEIKTNAKKGSKGFCDDMSCSIIRIEHTSREGE